MSLKVLGGVKSTLDVVVTVAMGIASVMLVWHLTRSPGETGREGGAPAIEDVSGNGESISMKHAAAKGRDSAPLVLVEYSDFQCPFCARHASTTFTRLVEQFVASGDVQYVMKHFPLTTIHPHALTAAHWANCAQAQGKFWDVHSMLFSRRGDLAQMQAREWVVTLGLDDSSFDTCMEQSTTAERVQADRDEGGKLGVVSTPTFFFGRRKESGEVSVISRIRGAASFETFRNELQRLLAISEQS